MRQRLGHWLKDQKIRTWESRRERGQVIDWKLLREVRSEDQFLVTLLLSWVERWCLVSCLVVVTMLLLILVLFASCITSFVFLHHRHKCNHTHKRIFGSCSISCLLLYYLPLVSRVCKMNWNYLPFMNCLVFSHFSQFSP